MSNYLLTFHAIWFSPKSDLELKNPMVIFSVVRFLKSNLKISHPLNPTQRRIMSPCVLFSLSHGQMSHFVDQPRTDVAKPTNRTPLWTLKVTQMLLFAANVCLIRFITVYYHDPWHQHIDSACIISPVACGLMSLVC